MVVLIRRSFKVDPTVTLFHWRREGEGEGEGRGRERGEGGGGRGESRFIPRRFMLQKHR